MSHYESMLAQVEAMPELWARVYPRVYSEAGAWPSPKVPAVALGQAVAAAQSQGTALARWPSLLNHYLVAACCDAHAMPVYFVGRTLLESLARTEPPPGVRWPDLEMPHPGMIFVLPRGSVRHPVDGDTVYIALARVAPEQPVKHSLPGSPAFAVRKGNLILSAAAQGGNMPMYDATLHPETHPSFDGLAEIAPGVDVRLADDGQQLDPVPLSAEDARYSAMLMSIAARLWLALLARPELVEPGQMTGRQKKQGGREFWSPTYLGARYRASISSSNEPAGEGVHASPRLHWRRGHFRQQLIGAGRSSSKVIWIEPTLVGEPKN